MSISINDLSNLACYINVIRNDYASHASLDQIFSTDLPNLVNEETAISNKIDSTSFDTLADKAAFIKAFSDFEASISVARDKAAIAVQVSKHTGDWDSTDANASDAALVSALNNIPALVTALQQSK